MKALIFCLVALVTTPVFAQGYGSNNQVNGLNNVFNRQSYVNNNYQNYNRFNNYNSTDRFRFDRFNRINIVDNFNVAQKNVEFDVDYFLGLNGYFSVPYQLDAQYGYRDQLVELKKQDGMDNMLRLLEQMMVMQLQQSQQAVQKAQECDPCNKCGKKACDCDNSCHCKGECACGDQKKNEPEPTPEPPVDDGNGLVPDPPKEEPEKSTNKLPILNHNGDLDQAVANIFINSCMDCHGTVGPRKGLTLIKEDENGQKFLKNLDLATRALVYDTVADINLKARGKKLMPLGGPKLPEAEIEILRLWMMAKAE